MNELITASRYMVLATADADGVPWVSPVWFATEDQRTFYWISDPNARHSRNIAARPEVAIVIFDSTVIPGEAKAVYMEARAEQCGTDGFDVFARESQAQGLWVTNAEDVTAPAKHRLYRAVAGEQTMLGPGDARIPLA
ncbi:MAG TPA: pyridoxamine 5'-phosphate oxidase family protein [Solirubrobacteraceae bacterium]|nr:pyridoxamine 5'-phosphate oxidase family protein [Solirubrobacteraceae bacterium]